MGRPLCKLHQTHTVSPRDQDICNIRTTTRFRIHPAVKRMNAQGFVSKNNQIDKGGPQKGSAIHGGGIIVQYNMGAVAGSRGILTCSSLYASPIQI
jgi:hypothetical protein